VPILPGLGASRAKVGFFNGILTHSSPCPPLIIEICRAQRTGLRCGLSLRFELDGGIEAELPRLPTNLSRPMYRVRRPPSRKVIRRQG